MPALGFFPWFYLHEDLEVDEFRLLRHEIGDDEKPQVAIDRILRAYRLRTGHAVETVMLLGQRDRELTEDLSDQERETNFDFAQLVALAGLAGREYFWHSYCNRDSFAFFVQSFTEKSGGIALVSRRRDGRSWNYVSDGAYSIECPHHVSPGPFPDLDVAMLRALVAARKLSYWTRLSEAIYWFNSANTDSDQVPEPSECVMMVSSFERLLDCRNGNENDLGRAFGALFRPDTAFLEAWPRKTGDKLGRRSATAAEAWIRDAFVLRGDLAHGRKAGGYTPRWSLREHLVLASYAFPLSVKLILRREKLYDWTDQDDFDVAVFERLLAEDLFPEKHNLGDDFPWRAVRSELRMEHLCYRAFAKVEAEMAAEAKEARERGETPGSITTGPDS